MDLAGECNIHDALPRRSPVLSRLKEALHPTFIISTTMPHTNILRKRSGTTDSDVAAAEQHSDTEGLADHISQVSPCMRSEIHVSSLMTAFPLACLQPRTHLNRCPRAGYFQQALMRLHIASR